MRVDGSDTLSTKVQDLPARPGVYLMKDKAGRVIYVGKAKVLRNRVRSYFQRPEDKDPKTRLLVKHIADLDYIVVDTEAEALIAENNLIKEYRPRYNIQLRDDKNFLCVKLSTKDDFPRIYLVRRIRKDGARYFGPYASAHALRGTVDLLNKHFPLRKCTDAQFAVRTRPCLMYQIKRCTGPCVGLISKEDYARIVDEVVMFLSGRNSELTEILVRRMEEAANDLRFEDAAQVRDQLAAVTRTVEKQKAVSADLADQDVMGLYREGGKVELAMLFVRRGKLTGTRTFSFGNSELDDAEIAGSFVKQFYLGDRFVPAEVLTPVRFEDADEVAAYLKEISGHAVRILVPQRGPRAKLTEMAHANAKAQFRSRQRRAEDTGAVLEEIQKRFALNAPPSTIDCFDISNLGGTLTVASKVRFREGEPDKSGYRRFRIKTAAAGDDYGSMREVLGRWIEQARKDGVFPDLVLIDGGKGQLAVAKRVFEEMDYIQSALASIAKPKEDEAADKFFLPERKNPVLFPRGSSALYLLQRVRDEAHRFAIEYNRKLRTKTNLRSVLEDVPGVGTKRRTALIRAFGSLKRLREASVDDIAETPGITRRVAESVHAFLAETDPAPPENGADG